MNLACSICIEFFSEDSKISSTLCGHIFHLDCLKQWIEIKVSYCFRVFFCLGKDCLFKSILTSCAVKQQLNKIEIKNKKTCPDCRAQCSMDQSRRVYLPIEATKNLETELQNLRKLKNDLFIIAVKKGYLDLYDRLVANQDDKNPTDSKVRMSNNTGM